MSIDKKFKQSIAKKEKFDYNKTIIHYMNNGFTMRNQAKYIALVFKRPIRNRYHKNFSNGNDFLSVLVEEICNPKPKEERNEKERFISFVSFSNDTSVDSMWTK